MNSYLSSLRQASMPNNRSYDETPGSHGLQTNQICAELTARIATYTSGQPRSVMRNRTESTLAAKHRFALCFGFVPIRWPPLRGCCQAGSVRCSHVKDGMGVALCLFQLTVHIKKNKQKLSNTTEDWPKKLQESPAATGRNGSSGNDNPLFVECCANRGGKVDANQRLICPTLA